jgi:hypothetical protein
MTATAGRAVIIDLVFEQVKPKFRSLILNDVNDQWLVSHYLV